MSNRKGRRSEMENDDIETQIDQDHYEQNYFPFVFYMIGMSSILIATEYDYLQQVPHPLISDLRFHPDNLGTDETIDLQAEHLFRFSTEQLLFLVNDYVYQMFCGLPNGILFTQWKGFASCYAV